MIEKLIEGGIVGIRDHLLGLQAEGMQISRTESGDPCWGPSATVNEAINRALAMEQTHYTAGAGISQLREAVTRKVQRENYFSADIEEVLVTSGAMHALYITARALVGPGTVVLVPTPTWTETVDHVVDAGGVPVCYAVNSGDESPINLDLLRDKMQKFGPKAMILNTPHNPTGVVVPEDIVVGIAELCREFGVILISDEAYEHMIFAGDESHTSPARYYPEGTISIFSCSKTDAMPGLRVGYMVCPMPDVRRELASILRKTTNGVNSIGQWGAVAAMDTHGDGYLATQVQALGERGRKLYEALEGHPDFGPSRPAGAFYIWCRLPPGMDSWDATCQLVEAGVGSAPGDVFGVGGSGHIRFSFSCSDNNIDRAVRLLEGFRLNGTTDGSTP